MYKAVGTHLVLQIDRAQQKARVQLSDKADLIAAPAFEYMQYKLQWGTILSVGEEVAAEGVEVGRKAIIHHTIEVEEPFLIDTLPNGDEIRWVNTFSTTFSYKFFGVLDENDVPIPAPGFIFCEPEPELEENMDYEFMEFGTETLRFATKKEGSLFVAHVPKKEEEKKFIKPVIAHVPPGEQYLKAGQQVIAQDFTRYPITLLGKTYWILSREFILSTLSE